jgi:hypothetical protein
MKKIEEVKQIGKQMEERDPEAAHMAPLVNAGDDHFSAILCEPFRRHSPLDGRVELSATGAVKWGFAGGGVTQSLQDALAEHPHVADIVRVLRKRVNEYVDKVVAERAAGEAEVRLLQLRLQQTRQQADSFRDLANEKELAGQSATRRVQAELNAAREDRRTALAEVDGLRTALAAAERRLEVSQLVAGELERKVMRT